AGGAPAGRVGGVQRAGEAPTAEPLAPPMNAVYGMAKGVTRTNFFDGSSETSLIAAEWKPNGGCSTWIRGALSSLGQLAPPPGTCMSRSQGSPANSKEPTLRGPDPMVASVSRCRMATWEESIEPSRTCIQLQSMIISLTTSSPGSALAHPKEGNGGSVPGGPR